MIIVEGRNCSGYRAPTSLMIEYSRLGKSSDSPKTHIPEPRLEPPVPSMLHIFPASRLSGGRRGGFVRRREHSAYEEAAGLQGQARRLMRDEPKLPTLRPHGTLFWAGELREEATSATCGRACLDQRARFSTAFPRAKRSAVRKGRAGQAGSCWKPSTRAARPPIQNTRQLNGYRDLFRLKFVDANLHNFR